MSAVEAPTKRWPTVRVKLPAGDYCDYGMPGTFSVAGDVIGTRLLVIGDRTSVTIAVGAGEITLWVPTSSVEVIS